MNASKGYISANAFVSSVVACGGMPPGHESYRVKGWIGDQQGTFDLTVKGKLLPFYTGQSITVTLDGRRALSVPDRVRIELTDLSINLQALGNMLGRDDFASIVTDKKHRELLKKQHNAMSIYHDVLQARMLLLASEVEEADAKSNDIIAPETAGESDTQEEGESDTQDQSGPATE